MFPLLETVLELTFRDGLEYARRIIFNHRFVIESRLSKQCDTVFTQKHLHKIRWMR